jgi:hypothetical protein
MSDFIGPKQMNLEERTYYAIALNNQKRKERVMAKPERSIMTAARETAERHKDLLLAIAEIERMEKENGQ